MNHSEIEKIATSALLRHAVISAEVAGVSKEEFLEIATFTWDQLMKNSLEEKK